MRSSRVVLLLIPFLCACSSVYFETGAPPPSVRSGRPPDTLQVGLRSGAVFTISHLSFQHDTIWGYQADSTRLGIPVGDIAWGLARGHRADAGRWWSMGIPVGLLVLEVVVFFLLIRYETT